MHAHKIIVHASIVVGGGKLNLLGGIQSPFWGKFPVATLPMKSLSIPIALGVYNQLLSCRILLTLAVWWNFVKVPAHKRSPMFTLSVQVLKIVLYRAL